MILYCLVNEFQISLDDKNSTFEDVENALRRLLGECASIITERMGRELNTMEMQNETN
jgi:hypothetical protein